MKKYIPAIRRSVSLIEKADKGNFTRQISSRVFEMLHTFLDIILVKMIVNSVAGGNDLRSVLWLTAALCAGGFLISFIRRLINRREQCHEIKLKEGLRQILAQKAASLDFEYLDNTDIQNKYRIAQENLSGNNGLINIRGNICLAVTCIFSIIVSIGMILPSVFVHTEGEGFMGFICTPWGFLTTAVLVAVLQIIRNLYFEERDNRCYEKARLNEKMIKNERIYTAFKNMAFGTYQHGKEIRLYAEQELIHDEMARVSEENANIWDGARKACIPYIAGSFIFMELLTSAVIYGYALIRAVYGQMSAGDVIAFAMLFKEISDGFVNLGASVSMIRVAVPNCEEIFSFLDIQNKQYKGTIPTEKRNDNEYEFEFRHVWFKYPNTEQYVLRDVNMKWRIGEKMALVGRNGCGKSTLVKLLCRLYDPTKGKITLNGIDIRKYDYDDYMALFSVVFQDSSLFAFSLAENVAASTEYDAEKVEDCVRRSGLSERLDTLPEGINTYLYKEFDEHGVEISGGEAQKLCLARAIYKGAPFIVLDEPTAALDPISEHDIYTKFNGIVGTRTAIYISHRLSSCRFCDEITVMDNGEIVERGSHDMLVTAGGHYAELWSAQAEYYRDTAGELFE